MKSLMSFYRKGREICQYYGAGIYGFVPHGKWTDARCLFVLSTGRTGTETLAHLLALGEEIQSFHEPAPKLIAERQQAYQDINLDLDKYKSLFIKARRFPIARANRKSRIYAETSPRLTFFAPAIAAVLSNARFIFLHRHPAEVVRSGMRRCWYQGHPLDTYRITPKKDDLAYTSWSHWTSFEKICWYWMAYNDFALSFVAQSPPSRILQLSSKELFQGSPSAIKRIFEFAGVIAPGQETVAKILQQKHNKQVSNDFPNYRDWSKWQKARLDEIAGNTITSLGYSLDDIGHH